LRTLLAILIAMAMHQFNLEHTSPDGGGQFPYWKLLEDAISQVFALYCPLAAMVINFWKK
jgi:hypothetical protein